jgi:radical SAM superfamily enzyme YgiQ (UPF0313 family)
MGAESLGVEYLSSVLKRERHETSLVFDPALFNDKYYLTIPFLHKIFNKEKEVVEKVISEKPDLVAFSVLTDTYQWACRISQEIKKRMNVPIIFGGIHPTSVPERVIKNDFVDMLCIGEGEEAFVELVNYLEKGEKPFNVKNIWFKDKDNGKIYKNPLRPLIQDLDSLPFPDKSLFEKHVRLQDTYLIMASRGCPFSCTYCSSGFLNNIYKGQKIVRGRSVDNIIDELKFMKDKYNYKHAYFVDDIFNPRIPFLKKFFNIYRKEIDVPFGLVSHTSVISEGMIKIIKNAGCFNLEIGIQSMCEKTRRKILNRYETNEQIKRAVDICEKYKLRYTLQHILGLPQDDEKKLRMAVKFYHKLKYCTKIDCYWLSYFPKTKIVDISKNLGIIDDKIIESIEEGQEKMYWNGGSLRNKELIKLCKSFDIFFHLIPTLPTSVNEFIYEHELYKYFQYLPMRSKILFNLINAIKNRDARTFDYIKYYLKNLV